MNFAQEIRHASLRSRGGRPHAACDAAVHSDTNTDASATTAAKPVVIRHTLPFIDPCFRFRIIGNRIAATGSYAIGS